jgi:hypothetical protein
MKITDHKIEISYHPNDPLLGKTEPYSWAILEWTGDAWRYSSYCDWADTIDKAFEEAKKACDKIYKEQK